MHALGTPAFLEAVRRSHVVVTRAVVTSADGSQVLTRVLDGGVEVDRNADVRRRCRVTLADDGLLVPQGPVRLLSQGAVVTASRAAFGGAAPLSVVTDGVTNVTTTPGYTDLNAGTDAWVQVDLGRVERIGSVRVWHYTADGRTYTNPRTEVSVDGLTWTVVAQPQPYAETAAGHLRAFSPVRARYVRDYISGNSVNASNHWQEVQVFSAPDVLSAYGGEVQLFRGLRYPATGVEVLVPLGVFLVTSVNVSASGTGTVLEVDGYDRALRVQRARFVQPYVVPAGTNVATALRDLIGSRVPGLTYSITPTTRTTPALFFDTGADPWEAARQLAESIGYELLFDPEGVLVARPEPDPTTARVVDTYTDGADSHLLSVSRATTTEQTYSRVVVTGEAATDTPPVRADAVDAQLQALLGDVPYFLTSAFVTTQAQAQEAADAVLRRVQQLSEQVKVDAVVNPALSEGDVVRVKRDGLLLDALYVVDGFSVPLRGGRHTLTMRKRRT